MPKMLYHTFFLFLVLQFNLGSTNKGSRYDVVIVGAGYSGVSAGLKLLENNFTNFVILEARGRIGGRVHAVNFGGSRIVLGGPFPEQEGKSVLEIRAPGGFLLEENLTGDAIRAWTKITLSPEMLNFTGSYDDYLVERFREKMMTQKATKKEIEIMIDAFRRVEAIVNGAETKVLGNKGIWEYNEAEEEDHSLLDEGSEKCFKFLKDPELKSEKKGLKGKIKLNHEVIKVNVNDKGVTVTCSNNEAYQTKRVLLTLPLGVLKGLPKDFFDPELPLRKQEVIEVLGYGIVERVYLRYAQNWWKEGVDAVIFGMDPEMKNDYKSVWRYGGWPASVGIFAPVWNTSLLLETWIFGNVVKHMEFEELNTVGAFTEILQELFGNDSFTVPKPEDYIRSKWFEDPYSRGSYSYPSYEAEKKNISPTDLGEPVLDSHGNPILLFAGEANSQKYYGSVLGAVESGQREAEKILRLTL